MATQRYTVTPHPIETLMTWVKSGEIAIPEIQRPFVWEGAKVRDLLDSLFRGYPVGYLIAWRNPTVRLKDGTQSAGKRILIDGQQRVTALMAALLGHEVLTKDYESVRIRIAFHPLLQKFEVANPAIQRDPAWIPDIVDIFSPNARLLQVTKKYAAANPSVNEDQVFTIIERLRNISSNQVGVIELAEDLDIETVTEIFIRVNSAGKTLSQADFAMSKIAANEAYGGNTLRKAIDYFCHLSVAPEVYPHIEKQDKAFVASEYFPKIKWLKDYNDNLYDPSYTDMLRVAFTSQFKRGRLDELVALLSGRNFETKQYEQVIAEQSFSKLKTGVLEFVNQTQFERFTMILRSAGFIDAGLMGGQNNVNFAYIIYLRGRADGVPPAELERLVRRWYALSVLRGRYNASPETQFDVDIRRIDSMGLKAHLESVIAAEMTDSYWQALLPQDLASSASTLPGWLAFQAAQTKLGDHGFASRDITVRDLLLNRSDVHHIFPKNLLKGQGLTAVRYNQVANFVRAQSEINIAISDQEPGIYFAELLAQCRGGPLTYGGITDEAGLRTNLAQNCIPMEMIDGPTLSYEEFLTKRRQLMAQRLKTWFEGL